MGTGVSRPDRIPALTYPPQLLVIARADEDPCEETVRIIGRRITQPVNLKPLQPAAAAEWYIRLAIR